ncbi:hepatic sodium/bile acid cotransporter isoform X2 [Poeciliopsis prolifica]|uniref:hepatic sodium/bile acid cotransporter isoform X2 n=1 Tax=Poeciliopsis prolifica TaxID=188132 RepID=UPI0024137B18|nr:hepatic sodium/bile acid cotransporter isoform X2 [Poeciliopsis prolifica]
MGGTENPFPDSDFLKNDGFSPNLTAANASLLYPSLLSPVMDKTINTIMITVLFIAMVSLGCTMEMTSIKGHILKPKGVAIAILSQYGIMPLTAFCLTKGFQVPEAAAVVILICGCCPGGALSNMLALAIKGDMNLSIVMTSCSTLLALAMMPLLLYLYCHGFSNLQKAVPYVGIITSLLVILVPCGAGILINHFRPQYSKIITKAPAARAEDCCYGDWLSEHPTVRRHSEGGLPPRCDRTHVPVPVSLGVLPGGRGGAARRSVQVLPLVHRKKKRFVPADVDRGEAEGDF